MELESGVQAIWTQWQTSCFCYFLTEEDNLIYSLLESLTTLSNQKIIIFNYMSNSALQCKWKCYMVYVQPNLNFPSIVSQIIQFINKQTQNWPLGWIQEPLQWPLTSMLTNKTCLRVDAWTKNVISNVWLSMTLGKYVIFPSYLLKDELYLRHI